MRKNKKIFHFHPNGKFALHFVKPLISAERLAGHSSDIVLSINADDVDGTQIPYDLGLRNLLLLPSAFVRIFLLLKRESPDAIVSHNSKSSALILFCAWLAGVQVRIYFNHGVPYVGYHGVFRLLLLSLEKLNLYFSTKVLTVSPDMISILKGLNRTKSITLINNGSACGIDLSLYECRNFYRSGFRRENGITENDFSVVFIGRPEKRKGFELVLNLWIRYFLEGNCKLVLCGPSERDVVKYLGFLPGNVIAMGHTDRIPEVLAGSDLLILPSFHEGLSYAILEAMASRCLVLANSIAGVRNLVKDHFNGFLVEYNNIDKYAEMINYIKSSPDYSFNNVRKNALETAEKYSRASFLTTYIAQFQ